MRCTVWSCSLLAIACGHAGASDEAGSTSETAASTTAADADSSSSAADSSAGDTIGDDGGLTHGVVKLQLARAEGQADDPFAGTATIVAVLQYGECLASFYDSHPELRQDGADGAAVFGGSELGGEGWLDRLCAPMVDAQIDCEVQAIVQDVAIVKQLTVVYHVTDAVEGGVLLFGPLPTETTAMCLGEVSPIVQVGSTDALTGNADNGTQLWGTESVSPTSAITNQIAPLQVRAAAVGG